MSALPAGARCARHPADDAADTCARCGDFLCARCRITVQGRPSCAKCEPLAGDPFPWERRAELGVVRAIGRTMAASWAGKFDRGFRDRSVAPALLYGVLLTALARTPIVWATFAGVRSPPPVGDTMAGLAAFYSPYGQLAWVVLTPFTFVLTVLALSSTFWIGMRAVGAPSPRFDRVVRAIAYTRGSLAPLELAALVPFPVAPLVVAAATTLSFLVLARALRSLTATPWPRMAGALALMVLALGVVLGAGGMAVVLVARLVL